MDPEYNERIDILTSSCREINNLINNILEVTSINEHANEIKTQRFSLRTLIQEVQNLYASACAHKNIFFSSSIDEQLSEFYLGDTLKMKEVLMDILSNAVNFTHEGEISLTVHVDKEHTLPPHPIIFTIRDTGIGMTSEQQEIAFNYFQRLSPSYHGKYPGLGLGLWRVKKNY